ncbi:ABC transporter permease [Paenibacillus artemisiicola]|uniref:ABC transporter permease n=1 Tax=Paenibacillus artemisiicola TaxID=1172618 RepID=UPI001F0A9936|nr:ABC transporter permease subunit [Paenibacillus artemisiicola]
MHKKRLKLELRKNYDLYIMILPLILYYAVFYFWPLYGIQVSFRDYIPSLGFAGSPFVGLKHFENFFALSTSWTLILNTLRISALTLLFSFPVPIILALMLNALGHRKLRRLVQTVIFAPHFVSIVVVVGMLNVFLNSQVGVVNQLIERLGMEKIDFMNSAASFIPVYILSGLWSNAGWSTIIYTGALTSIDSELYEAATIDGASKFQTIRYIDLPAIIPTMSIIFIMDIGHLMSVGWEKVYLMQNSLNLSVSEIISTYTYKTGILHGQVSYSAAIGLFNSVVNVVLLLFANKLTKKLSNTGIW